MGGRDIIQYRVRGTQFYSACLQIILFSLITNKYFRVRGREHNFLIQYREVTLSKSLQFKEKLTWKEYSFLFAYPLQKKTGDEKEQENFENFMVFCLIYSSNHRGLESIWK